MLGRLPAVYEVGNNKRPKNTEDRCGQVLVSIPSRLDWIEGRIPGAGERSIPASPLETDWYDQKRHLPLLMKR